MSKTKTNPTRKRKMVLKAWAVVKDGNIKMAYATDGCQNCDGSDEVYLIGKYKPENSVYESKSEQFVRVEISYYQPKRSR